MVCRSVTGETNHTRFGDSFKDFCFCEVYELSYARVGRQIAAQILAKPGVQKTVARNISERSFWTKQAHATLKEIHIQVRRATKALITLILERRLKFLNCLLSHIRRIANHYIEASTPFPIHDFREINLKIEGFLTVGQFVDEFVYLMFELFLLLPFSSIEVSWLEFFQPLEQINIEQIFLHAEERVAADYLLIKVRQGVDLFDVIFIDYEREPKT